MGKVIDMDFFSPAIIARFWSKTNKGSSRVCWNWNASTDRDGYGQFSIRALGHSMLAHRYSKAIVMGRLLSTEEHVLHTCDNPSCVNPKHLVIGTPVSNRKDCVSKNRQAKGEKCARSKLTKDQVLLIRQLHATGKYTTLALGKQFGVHNSAIGYIVRRLVWRHV